jgi:hypothetical protein
MSTLVSEPEIDALVQPYRAMFAWVNFDTQFLPSGPHSQARTFHVPGEPRYTGYLLIQAQDVESGSHAIAINGQDLPSFDLVPDATSGHWKVWMDRVPPGYLTQGTNRIEIRLVGNDSFTIANVAVHWRELV